MQTEPKQGQKRPGNRDALKPGWFFESDNEWGIPVVPPAPLSAVPDWVAPYRTRIRSETEVGQGAVHFFLEDYRFESVWNSPNTALRSLAGWEVVFSPDFSLYRNYPVCLQQFNVYRNRWCQAYWAYHGMTVIPTVSWSTPTSYPFAFAGIPRRSVVAVGTVGIRWERHVECDYFLRGWDAMLRRLDPVQVLVYGTLPDALQATVGVKYYPSFWEGIVRLRNRRKYGR